MKDDTVVAFRHSGLFSDDPLTDLLRAGARQLPAQAVEAEVEVPIAAHADLTDAEGRRGPPRAGVELSVTVICRSARSGPGSARSRSGGAGRAHRFQFIYSSALSQAPQIDRGAYLKGISSGDFGEALAALPGPPCRGRLAGAGCTGLDVQHH